MTVRMQWWYLLLQCCQMVKMMIGTYRIALYFGGAQLSRIGHLEAFHKTTFTRLVNGKEISFKSKSLVDLS